MKRYERMAMDSPQPDVYLVILNNQLAKGRTLDEVVHNLSQELNQKPDKIRNLLCQQSFVVESGISQEKAKAIQARIISAGVGCQIKKIPRTDTVDISTLTYNTEVICAKCGKQQLVSSNCTHCGIAFAKFNQNSAAVHSSSHKTSSRIGQNSRTQKKTVSHHRQHSNTARNVFIGIFLVIVMVFAVSTLNKTGQTNKHPITLDDGQQLYAIETHSIEDIAHYKDLIVPGYITIIDFSADWCPVCKRLDEFEDRLVDKREDVIVRKLDVSKTEDFRLALKKYNLDFRGVPYSLVFGKDGELIASDTKRQQDGQRYIHSLID
ncbi:MAG: thioredoxin family protein [Gammaproteobacteria bacterium]|nr:thioredoxin family protein [Gammaproteobacteria bacterium]